MLKIKDRSGRVITELEIIRALKEIKNGGDVYNLGLAITLRAINENEETENLIHIFELKDLSVITGIDYHKEKSRPYFGAIATKLGKMLIESAEYPQKKGSD